MRTLSAEELAEVRAALRAGGTVGQVAALLTETDGTRWSPAVLRYVLDHPVQVRVVPADDTETSTR